MSNENTQPTEEQVVVARFEAVKVATAVAERVLLNPYERNIIVQACALALQGLQSEYARITREQDEAVEITFDGSDEELDAEIAKHFDSSEE